MKYAFLFCFLFLTGCKSGKYFLLEGCDSHKRFKAESVEETLFSIYGIGIWTEKCYLPAKDKTVIFAIISGQDDCFNYKIIKPMNAFEYYTY